MGEKHGKLGAVGREEFVEFGGAELRIGSMEPALHLEENGRSLGMAAQVAKGFGGREVGDFGDFFPPMTHDEALDLRLFLGGELLLRSTGEKRLEPVGHAGSGC